MRARRSSRRSHLCAVLARGFLDHDRTNDVDAVRARPVAATGVVAALAMFLAREPLKDLAGKVAGSVGDKRKTRKTTRTKQVQTEKK